MSSEKPAPDGAGSSRSVGSRLEKSAEKTGAAQAAKGKISAPPEDGIHAWMMSAAWQGKKAALSAEETAKAMYAFEEEARRPFQAGEVEDAVDKVYGDKVRQAVKRKPREPKVGYNAEYARRIYEAMPVVLDLLRSASPVTEPWELDPADVLRMLFAGDNTLVCAGRTSMDFATATLEEHGDLTSHQLVVPGAMTAREGWTKSKPRKRSAHTLDNTGARVFNVLDFDSPPTKWQPALILHLMKFRPAALILSSGGKSLHAWFPVFEHESDNAKFWALAIALGADPALRSNRSQFVRMPNGRRDNGQPQGVVLLDRGPWRS